MIILGIAVPVEVSMTSQYIGSVAKRISDNFPPPYNAWREEVALAQLESDPQTGVQMSLLVFFVFLRLFKFLAMIPILDVPFRSIQKSAKELTVFVLVLSLFHFAFAIVSNPCHQERPSGLDEVTNAWIRRS